MSSGKDALRRRMLRHRSGLATGEVSRLSQAVLGRLRSLPFWTKVRVVLLYAPIKNEVDTWPVLEELWSRGVKALLPRCRSCVPGEMEWARAACRADLIPGAYDIPEPDPATCAPVADPDADIILIPGLAYDRSGFRLGYGGGYFDRLLASGALSRATSVGLCFSFQLLDNLPRDPWDRPVDCVISDEETIWTGN